MCNPVGYSLDEPNEYPNVLPFPFPPFPFPLHPRTVTTKIEK